MRSIIIGIAALAIGIGGTYYILKHTDLLTFKKESTTEATETKKAAPVTKKTYSVSVTKKTLQENTALYDYTISYPQVSGVGSAGSKINVSLETAANKIAADLKSGAGSNGPEFKTTLTTTSERAKQPGTSRVATFIFTSEYYQESAAHPLNTIETHSFDLETGEKLTIGDIFTSSSHLTKLQSLASAELTSRFKDAWFKQGVEAKAENYVNFTVMENSLDLIFNEYQVAAYAAGPQIISIPYASLSGMLEAKYIDN